MTPTCVDLFCGAAGAWTLGLHRAGFRTIAAAEKDDWRRETFSRLWPNVEMFEDVEALRATAEERQLGRPFLVCGSPPCKEISSANHQARGVYGDGLFFEAAAVVDALRPAWIAFENSSFLPARGYDEVAVHLERAGYEIWPLVLGAAHAGAAHLRARCFVIGRLDADADGNWESVQPIDGEVAGLVGQFPADADGAGLRIEQGRRCWPDGTGAPVALTPGAGLGPVGTPELGRHLRAYDGVPSELAELCRSAYGDSIVPALTQMIGESILELEAEWRQ